MHWREAESKEMFSLQLPSVCMHLHWDILDGTMAKKTGIFRSLIHTHKIFETAQHKNIKFYNAKMKRIASGKSRHTHAYYWYLSSQISKDLYFLKFIKNLWAVRITVLLSKTSHYNYYTLLCYTIISHCNYYIPLRCVHGVLTCSRYLQGIVGCSKGLFFCWN